MNQEDGWGGGREAAASTLNIAGLAGKDTISMPEPYYPYFNVFQAYNPQDVVILTPRGARHFAESATKEPRERIIDDQPESQDPLRKAQQALWPECMGEQ